MPGTDGIQLLRTLASDNCSAHIVVISGEHGKVLESAMHLGRERGLNMREALPKPVRTQELRERLSALKRVPKLQLSADLVHAITANELFLEYQPKFDCRLSRVIGVEALARWHHPVRGQVPPSTFIPVAEESGLILEIGEWMLRESCREAASWPNALRVAINLSAVQFRHGDLAGLVHEVLLETGLAPGRLELEITESVLIDDLPRALSILRRLKALGVRISMDDFGTGYSSLSNLQAFPFDKIKIDRSFISELERNTQAATIVRAVIALGRGLNLPVVAEGVETQAQLEFLSREACAEVQGYLLGRPLPIADYAGLVGRAALPESRAASVA
jgi:EAL domain-containing protein (putative c-di-GMP-specific phosphodiesterase class I)